MTLRGVLQFRGHHWVKAFRLLQHVALRHKRTFTTHSSSFSGQGRGQGHLAHIVLLVPVMKDRLQAACSAFVRSMVPDLFSDEAHPRVTFRTSPRSCEIAFLTHAETDHFINKCAEYKSLSIELEDSIGGLRSFSVKVKHDEPYQGRRRKWMVTHAWTAIQAEYDKIYPGAKVALSVSHNNGRISCEGSDLVVRAIWVVSVMDTAGGFSHSAGDALKHIAGFSDHSDGGASGDCHPCGTSLLGSVAFPRLFRTTQQELEWGWCRSRSCGQSYQVVVSTQVSFERVRSDHLY
jgi:hypothetical protein